MPSTVRILRISGSARKGSFNSALLREAVELLPPDSTLEIYDVSGFPLFNQDLESDIPPDVRVFREKVRTADAILFAAPEFNYSISAVLKNAIEWGSRPSEDDVWDGKPAAIVSASNGPRGGVRAQLHLRQIMVDLNMFPINRPQVLVARAQDVLDQDLKLKDERVKANLKALLENLVQWARKLKKED